MAKSGIISVCAACILASSCALDGKNSSPKALVENFGFNLTGDNVKKEGGRSETYQQTKMPVIDAEKPQTYNGDMPSTQIDTSYESAITLDRALVIDSAALEYENGAAITAPLLSPSMKPLMSDSIQADFPNTSSSNAVESEDPTSERLPGI